MTPATSSWRRLVFLFAAGAIAGVAFPSPLRAQTAPALGDLLRTTFVDNVVLAQTPAGKGVVAHAPVFLNDPRVTDVTNLIQQVSQQIGAELSTFPLGSSSGGFTYTFDANTGVFSRSTNTFGPAFADRAVTIGSRKWNFGVNYVHTSYNSLEGHSLDGSGINFYLLHQPLNPPSFVEGDVIQAGLAMNLTSDVVATYVNVGVTKALDVGVAIPAVKVAMNLTYHATILDFATHAVSPNTHLFSNGSKTEDFSTRGEASGIGDIVIRAKYNILGNNRGGGIAAALDLRLPTGDQANLLGTGTTQATLYAVLSRTVGKTSPHLNIGYTISGTGKAFPVPDAFDYRGGVEYAVGPRLTVVGDLIGRTEINAYRLIDSPQVHQFQQGNDAPIETTTLPELATTFGNLSRVTTAVGVKANPWQNLVISAHVLVPLNDAGLHYRIAPVLGFDYAF